jgi:hypothetical protein
MKQRGSDWVGIKSMVGGKGMIKGSEGNLG